MHRADAPGRVNLIGEHTDHSGGLVLPTALPQRTTVEVYPRGDGVVSVISESFGAATYVLGSERRSGDWADLVRGVTWALREAGHAGTGFDARVRSTIPAGAGLASSAALEIALLRALRAAFALPLDDLALALLAHRAENELVGAHVGAMDQLSASLAREGEALLIDMRSLATERIEVPSDVALVLVDSGIAHTHVSGAYNARRQECEEAARVMGVALRDATMADVDTLARSQPDLARRARHVVSENARVLAFTAALRSRDLATCGALLDASHASLRDDFAVSLPEVDGLAELLRAEAGVHGARIVGGGFGGAVLALADPAQARTAAVRAAERYRERAGRGGGVILPLTG